MTTSNQNTNAAVANTTITTTTTQPPPPPPPSQQPPTATTTTPIITNTNNNTSAPIHTRNTTASNAQQQQQQLLQQNTTITGAAICAAAPAAPAATTPTTPTTTTTATRSMQSDEDFNIRFVNLVRTHKCLYDKKVPEYRNRDNQEKAWSLISQETRESVIHCKERWRNLRACLSRYIKQQSGADPQHKPYYLTEHMAFLLPFLKSTRNSLDNNGNNSTFATLYHLSQQHQQHQQQQLPPLSIPHMNGNGATIQLKFQPQMQLPISYNHNNNNGPPQLDVKHSLSDNEDEETIDAFDPAITASLQQHMQQQHQQQQQRLNNLHSPALSDTASANTLQNFIPDVQLAELRTPDASQAATDLAAAVYANNINTEQRRQSHDETNGGVNGGHSPPTAKRIKTECHASEATSTAPMSTSLYVGGEHADMEFFRSILPDIAALTPQQKRKFKIGVLELIDDVVERYPIAGERIAMSSNGSSSHNNSNNNNGSNNSNNNNNSRRRNSAREWRK